MNNIKKLGLYLLFTIVGITMGSILIVVSEIINLSNINLIPFGGDSWAMWIYPILRTLGMYLSSLILKFKNPLVISLVSLIIFSLLAFAVLGDNIFSNPIPWNL